MKYKIKHKEEGWTGTLILEEGGDPYTFTSSHRCGFPIQAIVEQDAYKPDGEYVEDPDVMSLDELEIGESIKET